MAKSCPGCGAPMEYDPGFDSLVCTSCGNIIDPKTLSDADDFYHDEESPVDLKDTLEEFEELTSEMYDSKLYKCSQCGGEVLVTDTEISTRCVYCGATAVVFSRIEKKHRPDLIVPFSITKEEAMETLQTKLLSGPFIPKSFKHISPECVRGIYIPYYTYEGSISDTQRHTVGLRNTPYVFDGSAEFEDLLVECCTALDDRSTALLEPYNLNQAVEFDTSYLMGFYSNVQDTNVREANGKADLKMRTIFHARMREESPKSLLKSIHSLPKTKVHRTGYVLLPAWFITIDDHGTPYTFLVNGQSGKISGTAPWSMPLYTSLIIGISTLLIVLMTVLRSTVIYDYIYSMNGMEIYEFLLSGKLEMLLWTSVLAAGILIPITISKLKRLFDKRKRCGSVVTFIFSKKRQGGAR